MKLRSLPHVLQQYVMGDRGEDVGLRAAEHSCSQVTGIFRDSRVRTTEPCTGVGFSARSRTHAHTQKARERERESES